MCAAITQSHPKPRSAPPRSTSGTLAILTVNGCEDSRKFVSGTPPKLVNWLTRLVNSSGGVDLAVSVPPKKHWGTGSPAQAPGNIGCSHCSPVPPFFEISKTLDGGQSRQVTHGYAQV